MKSIYEVTNEEIEQYYNEENHSQYECAEHFGVKVGVFIRQLKKRGIKKDLSKHTEMIKLSKERKYGDPNYNNREKASETCLERYGVDNLFKDTQMMRDSYINKLGCDHPMHNEEIKKKVVEHSDYKSRIEKSRETYKKKTGYDNPSKNPECIKKMLRSKIENGCYSSPGTSNLERRLEKILNRKFDNVISKYRDTRYQRDTGYMYECDFYIPSEDLFIELNAHPSHHICPFNKNSDEHIALAEKYKNSDKKWENVIYESWVHRDTEKMECAIKNRLNYIVLYPTNTIFNNNRFNDKKYSDLIEYLIRKLNNK